MIRSLMVFIKNMKVSQKRCLETSIESFTGSSLSEQIIVYRHKLAEMSQSGVIYILQKFCHKSCQFIEIFMTLLQTKNNQGAGWCI